MASSRNVLISGGARGIGRCIARSFLEAGNRVFLLDIDEAELNHATHSHFKDYRGRVDSAPCNLRDVQDVRNKVQTAAAFLDGRIDVLVNNGSIATPHWSGDRTMEDYETLDEWQAYIETNLTEKFVMSQACIPYMKDEHSSGTGPCIIHIGSFRAQQSDPNLEGYAASKAGQLGLMHSMAISLGSFGIRVNLIAPGRIQAAHESTDGDAKGHGSVGQPDEKDARNNAIHRAGTPQDIADAAIYLSNARFVTGQDITVDGGAVKVK